jgi:hypothetical protein
LGKYGNKKIFMRSGMLQQAKRQPTIFIGAGGKFKVSGMFQSFTYPRENQKYVLVGGSQNFINGAVGTIRTCDLLIRSQVLYPTKLRLR